MTLVSFHLLLFFSVFSLFFLDCEHLCLLIFLFISSYYLFCFNKLKVNELEKKRKTYINFFSCISFCFFFGRNIKKNTKSHTQTKIKKVFFFPNYFSKMLVFHSPPSYFYFAFFFLSAVPFTFVVFCAVFVIGILSFILIVFTVVFFFFFSFFVVLHSLFFFIQFKIFAKCSQ